MLANLMHIDIEDLFHRPWGEGGRIVNRHHKIKINTFDVVLV